jgi:uncharacterized protein
MKEKLKKLICPKCNKEFIVSNDTKEFLPFCGKRCKMIDLGQWLTEKYVVEDKKPSNKK